MIVDGLQLNQVPPTERENGGRNGSGGGDGGNELSTGGELAVEQPATSTGAASSAGQFLPPPPVPHHAASGQETKGGIPCNLPTENLLSHSLVSTSGVSALQPTHATTVSTHATTVSTHATTVSTHATTVSTFDSATSQQSTESGVMLGKSTPLPVGISSSIRRPQLVPSTAPAAKTVATLSSPIAATVPDRPAFKIVDVLCKATL